ncbi:hypothetical protein [Luteibacter jiangsuensis]|nr:hypothetical protein [Luteibacter jiangsuensis]
MKYETAMLKTFFVVAVLTCVLTFGAMVTTAATIATPAMVAAR